MQDSNLREYFYSICLANSAVKPLQQSSEIGAPTRTRTWTKGLEDPYDIRFTIGANGGTRWIRTIDLSLIRTVR